MKSVNHVVDEHRHLESTASVGEFGALTTCQEVPPRACLRYSALLRYIRPSETPSFRRLIVVSQSFDSMATAFTRSQESLGLSNVANILGMLTQRERRRVPDLNIFYESNPDLSLGQWPTY